MPELKDLIGSLGWLNLVEPSRCARCLSAIPALGQVKASYLGKNEDGVFHEVCDEFRLLEPPQCPFCGVVIWNIFVKTVIPSPEAG